MGDRDLRDVVGGVLLIAAGMFVAIYASANYAVGTVAQIGPGMFPVALGCLLTGLGALILIPALLRPGEAPGVALRPMIAVLASIAAFAVIVDRFGLVPAVVALSLGAALADDRLGPAAMAVLAAALAVTAVLIFYVVLGIPFQLFKWAPL